MNAVAILLLALLPVPQVQLPHSQSSRPQPHFARQAGTPEHKGGKWYFARTGHAVYCYGPVMTLPQANGDLQKVATFCRDGKTVVPLKD